MSKLFLESLDKKRLSVFQKLKNFKNLGILGGGTALSLQIGHRVSFDFDIFVNQKIDENLWKKAKKVLGKKSTKLLDTKDQLDMITPENVAVTFFFDDYKPLFNPVRHEIINLMNLKDIAANKAYIMGRRPKWRDYVDLYFLLKENYINLEELIKLSKRKFDTDFPEKLFLQQLVYWKDITDYGIEFIKKGVSQEEIKGFLEEEVKKFKRKALG